MNKKSNYLILFFLLFIFINVFLIKNLSEVIIESCNIWLYNLVPTIFPFYIITDLLINYGFIDILKPLFSKFFNVSESTIFVTIFSMLTGFPSSARYIKNLIKEDLISTTEANNMIRFCHFSNPLFVIKIIGLNILKNQKLSYLILISHYLANFIIAFIFKKKSVTKTKNSKHEALGIVLTNSINSTFNSLLIILGNLITFQLLTKIIFNYFNFNEIIKATTSVIFEITSGIFLIGKLSLNIYIKAIIIVSALSFGGICVHSQTYGILCDTKVSYKNYLIGRIIQAIIAPLILTILIFFYCI